MMAGKKAQVGQQRAPCVTHLWKYKNIYPWGVRRVCIRCGAGEQWDT